MTLLDGQQVSENEQNTQQSSGFGLSNTRAALQIEDTFEVFALIRDSFDEINSFEKTAVFHGWVKYLHMFSAEDDCYSDFCYVYTASQQCLSSVGRHTR